MEPDRKMLEENGRVADLVEACLGCISPHMVRISLELLPDGGTVLFFLLDEDSELERDVIGEIVVTFEAAGASLDNDAVVWVQESGIDRKLPGRQVYRRWEASEWQ